MKLRWIASLALFASPSLAMHADILDYTFATTGVGSLDGTGFHFPQYGAYGVTFSMTANSATVTGLYTFSVTGPVTVSIAGGGTDTLTGTFTVFDPPNLVFELEDTTTGGGLTSSAETYASPALPTTS